MPIWQGILITSALPIIFQPVLYNGNYLIDGGAFDNYPIDIFTNNMTDDTLLGINLAAHCKNVDFDVDFFNYMAKLFTIIHHWTNINKINKYKKYTIEIRTYDNTEIMNTEISIEEKHRRINHGYESALSHFEQYEMQDTESEKSEELEKLSEELEESEESEEKLIEEINTNIISNEEILKKVNSINYII